MRDIVSAKGRTAWAGAVYGIDSGPTEDDDDAGVGGGGGGNGSSVSSGKIHELICLLGLKNK